MVGRNPREEFRRKRLRWTAIDYHAKNYDSADDLTSRHSAGGIDRLSQSLANIHPDMTPNKIEVELFALRNPLRQSVVLADKVGLGTTIAAALVPFQYWTEGSCGAHRLIPCSGWLMFATNYDLTIERKIFGND